MFRRIKRGRQALRIQQEWDQRRQGRGPTIVELSNVAEQGFGLYAGDAGLVAVEALGRYQTRRDGASAIDVVASLERDTSNGTLLAIVGSPLREWTSADKVGTFAGLVIRFVHEEAAGELVPWLNERMGPLGLVDQLPEPDRGMVWVARWGQDDQFAAELWVQEGRVRARPRFEEPPVGHPGHLMTQMAVEEAMLRLAESLGVEPARTDGIGMSGDFGRGFAIDWTPPIHRPEPEG
jgi:hypothetical protein